MVSTVRSGRRPSRSRRARCGPVTAGERSSKGAWVAPRAELARLEREQARLRRRLALRSFQLESLIELDRELSRRLDENALRDLDMIVRKQENEIVGSIVQFRHALRQRLTHLHFDLTGQLAHDGV